MYIIIKWSNTSTGNVARGEYFRFIIYFVITGKYVTGNVAVQETFFAILNTIHKCLSYLLQSCPKLRLNTYSKQLLKINIVSIKMCVYILVK